MDFLFPLTRLDANKSATVHSLICGGEMRRRLQDIGITAGTHIQCLQKSPYGDMSAFFIRGTVIALRCEDAENILVYE